MLFEFDQVPSRRHTRSIKWDFETVDGQLVPRPVGDKAPHETLIPLGLSDMDFRSPAVIQDALQKIITHGNYGYTRPDAAYYQAICSWMRRRHDWSIDAEWVLTTTGTMQSVILAIQTLTEPGHGIIIQPPLFGPIGQAVTNNGRQLVQNPLIYQDGRYKIDFTDLARKAAEPDCQMLIICHPHNPVGRVWTRAEIGQIGQICREHELILVTDEVHGELCYSWSQFEPVGAIDAAINERLVVCTGPSKAFNLPGLRTSLAIIPDPALRSRFVMGQRNLNELFGYNMIGITAIQAAYEGGEPWLNALMDYIESNYRLLEGFVGENLPGIQLVAAEGLYLAWLDCRALALDDAGLKQLFLQEAKVALEWGPNFGQEGSGFARLNLACPQTTLQQGLNRMQEALSRL